MKWVVAAVIAVILVLTMPAAIAHAKASVRGKGRMAGVALAIGLAFSAVLDPAKKAAIEHIQKKAEAGDEEAREVGDPLDDQASV
jgi:competence protein ComGC